MVARALHAARMGFWLGWQIQSNWTDPLLFFIYSVVRPLGGTLILVFMFFVVAGGRRGPMLDFFVVGAALWPTVIAAIYGLAYGVLEDREHFRTSAYIYTAPIPFWAYIVGRGLVSVVLGLPGTLITLTVAVVILHTPLALPAGELGYALIALAAGVAGLLALGLTFTGLLYVISGEAWRLPEALGQALYLVCGAIFPVPVLPDWLEPVARAFPITYWLEAMRRAILPAGTVTSFPAWSSAAVLEALLLTTLAWSLVGGAAFLLGHTQARRRGILDAGTMF
jgi:ABC-2 type transport system permease protein